MEMTWKWLLQIFKGEGQVTDIYVSRKRRRNYECQFTFVRFKRLDEARRAVRNLNGVRIREKTMKASFAKYDGRGLPWKDANLQEADKDSTAVRRAEKLTNNTNGGRGVRRCDTPSKDRGRGEGEK